MKTKTKVLNLIGLLGCSLLCIYNVNAAGLPSCVYESGKISASSPSPCFDETKGCLYDNNNCSTTEGNYFFLKSNDSYVKYTRNDKSGTAIQFGYVCANSKCSLIENAGIYKVETGVFINTYKNNNSVSYQICDITNYDYSIAIKNNGANNGSLRDALILCESDSCVYRSPNEGDVYMTTESNILKCNSKTCTGQQTDSAIFINAAAESGSSSQLIKCTAGSSSATCKLASGNSNKYYMNGMSAKSIIYCNDSNSCKVYKDVEDSYYLNGNEDKEQLISCHNGSCSLQKGLENGHYLTMPLSSNESKIYNVIECVKESEKIVCKVNSRESQGYYRNYDENTNSTSPLIQCTSSNCSSLKLGQDILPGYYVDISDGNANILVCNENSCEDDSTSKTYTSSSPIINGNYVFKDGNLQLVINTKAEIDDNKYSAINSNSSDEEAHYYYVEVSNTKGFPGINAQTTTLFKVSKYYIARVISDGAIFVSDTDNKITKSGTPGTETTIYNCVKSKKTCTINKSCTVDTYFLDSMNKIGYYCNTKGIIEQITANGYYIDSSNGNNKRNLIHCENSECTSSVSTNYYVNAGSNSSSKPLIHCNSSICYATLGSNGYYLSGSKIDGNYGIINCSSSTSCAEVSINSIKRNEHYYINNGGDNVQKPLIQCKNKSCLTVGASEGYYITNDSSNLINCENASSCSVISASVGFYNTAVTVDSGKKIIECSNLATVTCELKDANVGYYVAKTSNVLINCNSTPCKAVTVSNGIYRSATTKVISTNKRDSIPDEEEGDVNNKERSNSSVVYNIISCTNSGCTELSTSELSSIPVCTFNNNKCFINNKVSISTTTVSSISAGGYCTNSDRSIFYFATDSIVIDPYIIDGTTSIYTYTTTTTNCIEAVDKYSNNYYTVGSSIYKVKESSISQLVATGYYFINVEYNTLVSSNSIENYNNEKVKLFKCNDNSCTIIDKSEIVTYFADINKRIIMFNPNSDSYSFAYENDVICIYSNNKCTPREDIKNMEFCITYKGELCLVTNDIKSRETGECYKADSITSKIYGLSQYMYSMNAFAAERITDTAYYVISLSTNSTATTRDYDGRTNSLRIYGCLESKCDIQEPEQGVYYYDSISRYMFRYDGEKWNSPQSSGYALISINSGDTYINRFSLNNNRTIIDGKVKSGYYYTIDKEMYECDQEKYLCEKITNSGYYFTVSGEIYQCIYDSEGLEATECVKKNCIVGQYYYLNSKYYYCSSGYMLNLVSDKTCEYDDKVIINFPVAFSESNPDKIKSAVESVSIVNNSTAVVTNINNKYITSVSGVFTNCTYTVEEKDSEFDLVCVNNYVAVNDKTDNIEICSLTSMGYTECIDDENNPEKCNPSGAISQYKKGLTFILSLVISSLLFFI
ncbi:scaffoldin [Piromyces finnis]|uniref:Scaffoldin n=1 Tax=Piromyces finnis TaxID=1754191 RepID=A0A1Y1VM55_9FUNG|nr:scaffoldin [Piromyces finnis]|eukprot:ORX59849.1 scaffoldin [Piromyces finnis]